MFFFVVVVILSLLILFFMNNILKNKLKKCIEIKKKSNCLDRPLSRSTVTQTRLQGL